MENRYTINQLATTCKVSTQSIYKLLSKNQPTVKQFSTKQGRKIYYGQEVLDLLLEHYGLHQEEGQTEDTSANAPKTLSNGLAAEVEDNSTQSEIATLKAQIESQKTQIEELTKQLAEKDAERKQLLEQNGQVLLLLSQERQERIKLLPAPKKSFGERLKGFFGKKEAEKQTQKM